MLLSATPASLAQEEGPAPDIEDAKTPLNLIELLPGDEKDWPEPFWPVVEAGEFVSMTLKHERFQAKANRVTREEVVKRFKLQVEKTKIEAVP